MQPLHDKIIKSHEENFRMNKLTVDRKKVFENIYIFQEKYIDFFGRSGDDTCHPLSIQHICILKAFLTELFLRI